MTAPLPNGAFFVSVADGARWASRGAIRSRCDRRAIVSDTGASPASSMSLSRSYEKTGETGEEPEEEGLSRAIENADLFREARAKMIPLNLKVIARLEVQPKAIASAEVACEPKGRIRGDGARPVDDLVDATGRDADIVGHTVLRDAERLEEIGGEDFARMNRGQFTSCHGITQW